MPTLSENGLRILVISDYRDTVSARSEAEIFVRLSRMGHQVTVMTHADCPLAGELVSAGVSVIDFHPVRKWSRREIGIIRNALRTGGHDILHLFNSRAMTAGVQAARGLPVKVVVYRGFQGNVHWWMPSSFLKVFHPRVDCVHCMTESVKRSLEANRGFSKAEVAVIPKGHDLSWYSAITPCPRGEWKIPDDAFLLVCVANRRRMKGMPYLAKALALLPEDMRIYTLLVGRDLDTPEVRRRIARSPHAERVRFTGFRRDALRMIKAADAFVLPSIFGEALTKAVIEAMALGTPVVMTDVPGNRDLIRHKREGIVVKRADPSALAEGILTLYRQPALRQQFAEAARARLTGELSADRTAQKMEQLYRRLRNM